jgi:hypothetical protein
MGSSRLLHDNNELLCILEKDVDIAYQKIAILDFDSTDEEITCAIRSLGRSLYAYRFFTGKNLKAHHSCDFQNRLTENLPEIP